MGKMQDKKQREKTPMERHPNYQRHLDELARLSPKEREQMEEHYRKYIMDNEEETSES